MSLNHAMIDLETLGVGNNASIVQIGAVMFKPDEDILVQDSRLKIDVDVTANGSAVQGEMDAATVLWWMNRPPENRKLVFGGKDRVCLQIALARLNQWFETWDIQRIWANSPSFDIVLLKNAYLRTGVGDFPFDHRAELDYRTVRYLVNRYPDAPAISGSVIHEASADAVQQAAYILAALKFLGEKK